jgi:hypothetical protein
MIFGEDMLVCAIPEAAVFSIWQAHAHSFDLAGCISNLFYATSQKAQTVIAKLSEFLKSDVRFT